METYRDTVQKMRINKDCIYWYTAAACRGHREAQYRLGLLYKSGLYVLII